MGRSFRDRWGAPVQAASERGVVLLDEAIEALAALAGDPVAGAEEAVAADDELVLAHIYRAYLPLYGTSAQGVAAADGILKRLEGAGERAGEREALHLQAARSWASGEWEAAARALERALLRNPCDLLALKVAQDLYFFLGNRLDLRDVAARVLPAWPPERRAGDTCRAYTPSAWRRMRTTGRLSPAPGRRCTTTPAMCGPCTPWLTCLRWKAASRRALRSSRRPLAIGRPVTSPSTTGGTAPAGKVQRVRRRPSRPGDRPDDRHPGAGQRRRWQPRTTRHHRPDADRRRGPRRPA